MGSDLPESGISSLEPLAERYNAMLHTSGVPAPTSVAMSQPDQGCDGRGHAHQEYGPPVRLDAYPADLFMSDSSSDGSD